MMLTTITAPPMTIVQTGLRTATNAAVISQAHANPTVATARRASCETLRLARAAASATRIMRSADISARSIGELTLTEDVTCTETFPPAAGKAGEPNRGKDPGRVASVKEGSANRPWEVETMQNLRIMRLLGALAILGVGAVHLQRYIGADYRAIPTIGPLFLLNAIGSAIVGVPLLFGLERRLEARKQPVAVATLAVGAVLIAIGSLIALFISENGSLFGFTESGYHAAVVAAIAVEAATIVLLGPVAAVAVARALSGTSEGERRTDAEPATGRPQRRSSVTPSAGA
jgi:hypothetical protein